LVLVAWLVMRLEVALVAVLFLTRSQQVVVVEAVQTPHLDNKMALLVLLAAAVHLMAYQLPGLAAQVIPRQLLHHKAITAVAAT
jgi:hypothetical protein